ncbi:MAG: hypothetical protein H6721_05575 [Sandaracinus sp.]|nr:hypothetical protein [Sandaracinus sp.]
MGKRLLLGLIKGLLVGAALGAGAHFGLGWTTATGLLAYLLAMGAGASAGLLGGKPPWRQDTWIESVLKAVAGLGVGALLYWVTSTWVAIGLPLSFLGLEEGTPWTSHPLLMLPAVALVFGTLVELDNTDDGSTATPSRGPKSAKTKARIATADTVEVEEAEVLPARRRER